MTFENLDILNFKPHYPKQFYYKHWGVHLLFIFSDPLKGLEN